MWPAVASSFVKANGQIEGVVPFLYLDVKGLVTIAIGVLVDPIGAAMNLPLKRLNGTTASPAEITAAWHAVKARQDLKMKGGMAYAHVTNLRLTDEGVLEVTKRKLEVMEKQLQARFPEFESWPADAQFGVLNVAWACGPAFRFPKLATALMAREFLTAADECRISEDGNPGVKPRNVLNRQLFINAACAEKLCLEPSTLYWPDDDAVRAFQLKAGLTVDGIIGPKTLAALTL